MMLLHYLESFCGRHFAVMYNRFSIYFSGKEIGRNSLTIKIENKRIIPVVQIRDGFAQIIDGSAVEVRKETAEKKNLERIPCIKGETIDRKQRQLLRIGIIMKNLEFQIKFLLICVFHVIADAGSFVRGLQN